MSERNTVCERILREAGLGLLWSDTGPADDLFDPTLPARLTPYQRLLVNASVGIWRGKLEPQAASVLGL